MPGDERGTDCQGGGMRKRDHGARPEDAPAVALFDSVEERVCSLSLVRRRLRSVGKVCGSCSMGWHSM